MMFITVAIEALADGRYRASTGQILSVSADGASELDALENARLMIRGQLPAGESEKLIGFVLDVPLPEPPPPQPLSELILDDDEWFRTFQQAIEENRRREDDECSFNEWGHFMHPAHEDYCI